MQLAAMPATSAPSGLEERIEALERAARTTIAALPPEPLRPPEHAVEIEESAPAEIDPVHTASIAHPAARPAVLPAPPSAPLSAALLRPDGVAAPFDLRPVSDVAPAGRRHATTRSSFGIDL